MIPTATVCVPHSRFFPHTIGAVRVRIFFFLLNFALSVFGSIRCPNGSSNKQSVEAYGHMVNIFSICMYDFGVIVFNRYSCRRERMHTHIGSEQRYTRTHHTCIHRYTHTHARVNAPAPAHTHKNIHIETSLALSPHDMRMRRDVN